MSFATMVRPTFSSPETMVGMPFREWQDAANEGAQYLRAGNYGARVAILDREGNEVPSYGGFIDREDSSPFDSLTTPAEV